MNRKIGLLLSGSLAVCLVAGCNVAQLETEIKETIEAMDLVKKVNRQAAGEEPIIVTSIMDLRQSDLVKEIRELLAAGNYTEIEKRAAQLRSKPEEFLNGDSKLSVFYDGLSGVGRNGTDADWVKLEKRLLEWRKKHPQSVTVQVALMMAYYRGAFLARGEGYADEVTPEQGNLMHKRQEQGVKLLTSTMDSHDKCPGWHLAAQQLMFLEGVDREDYDFAVDKAVRQFPQFATDYHLRYAHYLMDRWFGEAGDWQAYADKVAKAQPEHKDGDILYARMLWYLIRLVDTDTAPELKAFDWTRAKRGFDLLLAQPESHAVAGAFAVAAWKQRDRATLKRLFEKQIGNHIDYEVWSSKEQFQQARKWALEEGA
jgi:hypothetical protein